MHRRRDIDERAGIFSWSGERNPIPMFLPARRGRHTSEDRHFSIDDSDLRSLLLPRFSPSPAKPRPSAGVRAETWARLCRRAHVVPTDLRVNRESVTASFLRGRLLLLSRSYQLCKVRYFRSKIGFWKSSGTISQQ